MARFQGIRRTLVPKTAPRMTDTHRHSGVHKNIEWIHELQERAIPSRPVNRWRQLGTDRRARRIISRSLEADKHTLVSFCALLGRLNKMETGRTSNFPGLVALIKEYMTVSEREKFFKETLPKILALSTMNKKEAPITAPALTPFFEGPIDFTRKEVAFILASNFLGNFAKDAQSVGKRKHRKHEEEDSMNHSMLSIFISQKPTLHQFEKFRCISSYLEATYDLLDQSSFAANRMTMPAATPSSSASPPPSSSSPSSSSPSSSSSPLSSHHHPFHPETEGLSRISYHRRGIRSPVVSFKMLSSSKNSPVLNDLRVTSGPIKGYSSPSPPSNSSSSSSSTSTSPPAFSEANGKGRDKEEEEAAEGELSLQTVFSSNIAGSGFFGSGCGQEEMMMCMYPEALLMHYLLEPLADNECGVVIGAHHFNEVSGHGSGITFEGARDLGKDPTPYDIYGRKCNALMLIDPLEAADIAEFGMETVSREVFKAYTAFSLNPVTLGENYGSIATGNWGGGGAGGDPHLRLLVQWIAATFAGRPIRYHLWPDSDEEERKKFAAIEDLAQHIQVNIKDVMDVISNYSEEADETKEGLLGMLKQKFSHRM